VYRHTRTGFWAGQRGTLERRTELWTERLRPQPELKVNDVDPGVLTTFAGLLLRDLLDRFNGDASLAVAAYNGGPGNTSMRYEERVRAVATHVQSVLDALQR